MNNAKHFGMSRRSFIGGALATAGAIALAGNFNASEALAFEAPADAPTGGEFRFKLTNPVAIEPFGAEENMGVEVMFNLFDPLCKFDFSKGMVVPLACESYEQNDTADEFTFHLRPEAKFHNGQPVTSKDFKYAWERLCKPDFQPAPSSLGYKCAQIAGSDEMLAGTAKELDIECPDDLTLVVHLKAPFADFASISCERALAPVPAGCTDTEADFLSFREAPIGNGPFMMDGKWEDGQYIRVKRFDDYWGDKPLIDSILFDIYTDDQTGWLAFEAGDLDYTIIPSGMFNLARETYGEATEGGYLANPGQQTITCNETSVYYLICNNLDPVMANKDLRIAISFAVDRQAICDTVLQGTRSPATNILATGIPGSGDGVWKYTSPVKDLEKAEEYFIKAGYPKNADGKRDLTLTFSSNSGSSNEDILQMVAADLEACGVTCTLAFQEWASYIDKLQDADYQIGRLGWTVQVPYADGVLQPLFYTDCGDNNSYYSNPEFDAALNAARQVVDDEERLAAYNKANEIVAEDFPVIPMFFYKHTYVVSNRVNNFYYSPSGYITMTKCWLS